MDSWKKMSIDSNWHWTNEKHTDFLNSMEASFVRTMFHGHISRLDRYIPDTSESTKDLGKERRRRYSTSELIGRKKDKKTRLLSSPSDISSQDQVVPQVSNKRDDKDEDET